MRPRLTYANVVATLALFVALGGTSFAAFELGKNSVKSKNIAKEAVHASDIAKDAVSSAKVKDGSLLSTDFKAGQLPTGPTGLTGPTGKAGATGAQGPPGISGLLRVYVTGTENSSSPKGTTATCPAGKVAIGGGYDIVGGKEPDVAPGGLANVIADVVEPSSPSSVPGSVSVEGWEEEPTSLSWGINAIALCANVAP